MRRRGITVSALVAAALVIGVAAPAEAGGAGRIKAGVAKREQGPYKAFVKRTIGAEETKLFFMRVKNKHSDDGFDVEMQNVFGDHDGFTQKYFRNGNNISDAVKGSGYEFHLEPGQVKRFELKIKANEFVVGAFCSLTDFEEVGAGAGLDEAGVLVNGSLCN
jgi:hypothetical protein